MTDPKKAVIIGSGFAGLSAASFMAKAGWDVTLLEKNAGPGGRARQWISDGFTFDMGPSFYWMPDVFERYFEQFNKKTTDYYQLTRLDPSYRVYWQNDHTDIPASYEQLKIVFDSFEPGAGSRLDTYLKGAAYKYEMGMNRLVYKPGRSITEFMDWQTISGIFKLDVFSNIRKHIHKYFNNPQLRQLMEFPVLFLGALPQDTPALYSLMNYADIRGGTWYPQGGMYSVVNGMYQLAVELGVKFRFNEEVLQISIEKNAAKTVISNKGRYDTMAVISGADYQFTESALLPPESRTYSSSYWDKKVMAPSCLLYFVGINKKMENIPHHSLFFDASFDQHGKEIYSDPKWPENPLFYVSISSRTDKDSAPPGCENLFFLVPVASGLTGDTEELREVYFNRIADRFEKRTGQTIRDSIICKKTYSLSDFVSDYHSYRGNAYGLANTLKQTAIFKPSCKSKKVSNLFYTGQLTVPGPGVPPSLISGEVVAREVIKTFV
ncbi:MAG: phytoene desaturase family protein [Chitinophagaceae bacterium]